MLLQWTKQAIPIHTPGQRLEGDSSLSQEVCHHHSPWAGLAHNQQLSHKVFSTCLNQIPWCLALCLTSSSSLQHYPLSVVVLPSVYILRGILLFPWRHPYSTLRQTPHPCLCHRSLPPQSVPVLYSCVCIMSMRTQCHHCCLMIAERSVHTIIGSNWLAPSYSCTRGNWMSYMYLQFNLKKFLYIYIYIVFQLS